MANIINVNEFKNKVDNKDGLVVVDFLQLGVDHVKCYHQYMIQ